MVITIKNDQVEWGHDKVPLDKFCVLVAQNTVHGLRDTPIPDQVRWIVEQGKYAIYIIELQPELRSVLWKEEDGCNCLDCVQSRGYEIEADIRTIATPYVVLKAFFYKNQLVTAEVYYRNEPLKSIEDELYLTNLKNMMNQANAPGYMCIDGVNYQIGTPREEVLGILVNHLWSGEFNDELSTTFGEFCSWTKDKRLKSIEDWEAASKADPEFVLGVEWRPAGVTVRKIIENSLKNTQSFGQKALGNLVLKAR